MNVLVTGAGGFVGGVVARMLRERGDAVRTVARNDYPALTALGCEHVRGDLADPAVAKAAVAGMDAVVHVAAKAGYWGSPGEYEASNIAATQFLLDACAHAGVKFFVFTSSPSITFDGGDTVNGNESLPYSEEFLAHYPRTKAEAERRVLAANGTHGLTTCAIRPHGVFGPGDPHLIPRLISRAKAGRLAWIGSGNQVDLTYVDNAAHAHLLALDTMVRDPAKVGGKAYFISQGSPVNPEAWVNALFERIGLQPVTRHVPLAVAYLGGAVLELAWPLLRLKGEPPMTRFSAIVLGTTHTYDLTAARRDLGYQLLVDEAESVRRTAEWFKAELAAGRL